MYDWEFARNQCVTLDKFLTAQEKVWHNDLFFLASNMFRIEGGQLLYKKSVKANPYINDNKQGIMSYIKYRWDNQPIYPMSFQYLTNKHIDCKMSEHYKNLLDMRPHGQYSKARLIEEPKDLISIEDARAKLKTEFDKAMADYPVPYAEQHSLSEIPTPIIQLQPNIKNKAA